MVAEAKMWGRDEQPNQPNTGLAHTSKKVWLVANLNFLRFVAAESANIKDVRVRLGLGGFG